MTKSGCAMGFCCVWAFALAAWAQQPTYVRITGDQFTHNGVVFKIKGTNYYPQNHMWAAMWSSWDWPEIVAEIGLVKNLGLNAVRILVPYSHGGWNGPNIPADRLQKLEDVVNEFGRNGIRSCVTLFDWETSFPAAGTSTETNHISYLNKIVTRLKDNPYVFCWDVKNEPDHPSNIGGFDNWDSSPGNKTRIVSWLSRMEAAVKAHDTNHPVSAGIRWWTNVKDVIAFEDIAMFHSYWPNIGTQQIPDVKGYMTNTAPFTQKPILVEEFGWPTNPTPGLNSGQLVYNYTEAEQVNVYTNHLNAFSQHNIAGGIQWMTFDATVYSGNPSESFENHFGLWKYGYNLKPGGAWYRDHFPVSLFPIEPDGSLPNPVTGLNANVSNTRILLYWTGSSSVDFTNTVIHYSTTSYPTSPTDGSLLANVPSAPSASLFYAQTPYLYHTRYYYTVYARDASGNYSTGVNATVLTGSPGDFDLDGDIDMSDFAHFQNCMTGLAIPQNNPSCQNTKMDDDEDVDQTDFALLLKCLSGADQPAAADCAIGG